MKNNNTKLSKRTMALLTATVLLATSGGFVGTRAALQYKSDWAKAEFQLEHLQVHLLENGRDVCEGNNEMNTVHRGDKEATDKVAKYYGDLLGEPLGYANDDHKEATAAYEREDKLGSVEPGRAYDEVISAKNGTGVDQYLRLTITKYWVKDGEKFTKLDPSLIKLSYGDNDYNEGAWKINKQESTSESATYYYTSILGGEKETAPLFDTLTIDKTIVNEDNMTVSTDEKVDGNKKVTVYTYSYDYDGCTFYIEADVQALQTHNINDAIKSIWGVSNVTASNGKLTVK